MALDLRRSTVYDFSDLRLHRDGTRIQQTDRNYESSRRQFSVKDAQGKWRAKDAAGLGTVPKMRCVNYGADSARKCESEERGEGRQLHAKRGRISVEEKKRGVQPLEYRTVNRRRFEESLDFLDGTSNGDAATAIEDKTCLPVPSSELLKNIHYIAAEFYTERGQLLNLGKEYRAEKKRKREGTKSAAPRKKRRVDEITGASTDRCRTPDFDSDGYREFSNPDSGTDSSSPSDATGNNEGSVAAEEAGDIPSISKSIKERKKRYTRSLREIRQKHQQDMYKVMNGSALMVLGILVQEHVAKLVQGKVPEGWEDGLLLGDEEEEWSEEWGEQVESEREGEEGEDEDEDEDEDRDIESEMEDDGSDSGRTDDKAHEEREIREEMVDGHDSEDDIDE